MDQTNTLPTRAVVADIGGTNARFAVADLDTLDLSEVQHFLCSGHPTLAEAACVYLKGLPEPPSYAAIAVAAPVVGEEIRLTNSPWSFARQELCRIAGLQGVLVLNDFQALALSLPHLHSVELHQIGGGAPADHAPKVVLGPGTGLGVGGLVWSGTGWVPVASEGGHISLAARDAQDFAVMERLRSGRAHLSVERALSGPGLSDLYRALATLHGEPAEELAPNDVARRAIGREDQVAEEALQHFVTWLGRFAGDAALVFGARGGVYLGGGIAPKILDALTTGAFRKAFEAKGRMGAFLAPIPIYVILAEFAALKGAAAGLHAALEAGGSALTGPGG
jgi:glucokinase